MTWLEPITLSGPDVRLELLDQRHHDDLVEATQDGQLWTLWYTSVPRPEEVAAEIRRRLDLFASQTMLPFAVVEAGSGKALGMTTYMNVDAVNRRLEIGSTWMRRSAQRTNVNTQCKLLLLTHAFETMNCIAVEFRTHFFNHQSRAGIERLGAKLDGILRSHQILPNGTTRDTCVYSVIASEWPTVKAHLSFQAGRAREAGDIGNTT